MANCRANAHALSTEVWLYQSPPYPTERAEDSPRLLIRALARYYRNNSDCWPRILGFKYSYSRLSLRVQQEPLAEPENLDVTRVIKYHKRELAIFWLLFKEFEPTVFLRLIGHFKFILQYLNIDDDNDADP